MSYGLNSLKDGYIGDSPGEHDRGMRLSADCSSYEIGSRHCLGMLDILPLSPDDAKP